MRWRRAAAAGGIPLLGGLVGDTAGGRRVDKQGGALSSWALAPHPTRGRWHPAPTPPSSSRRIPVDRPARVRLALRRLQREASQPARCARAAGSGTHPQPLPRSASPAERQEPHRSSPAQPNTCAQHTSTHLLSGLHTEEVRTQALHDEGSHGRQSCRQHHSILRGRLGRPQAAPTHARHNASCRLPPAPTSADRPRQHPPAPPAPVLRLSAPRTTCSWPGQPAGAGAHGGRESGGGRRPPRTAVGGDGAGARPAAPPCAAWPPP